MKVQSALDLVNALVYFPGWRISAEDHTKRFEGAIKVRIDYPAQETGRENARLGYPESIMTYASFPVVVETCDDTMLYRKIVNALVKIQTHEIREALRVEPTLWAPFHPHNIDGMRRWKDSEVPCSADDLVIDDLQFGIA